MANGHKNLTLSRGPVNVWEQPGWGGSLRTIDRERVLCGVWGALLTAYGMRRRDWVGRALTAAGVGILTRAASGKHDLTRARTLVDRALDAFGWMPNQSDRVSADSDMSFPASDAPSWTPTSGVKTRDERAKGREGQTWQ
jgi:hypothetical protein